MTLGIPERMKVRISFDGPVPAMKELSVTVDPEGAARVETAGAWAFWLYPLLVGRAVVTIRAAGVEECSIGVECSVDAKGKLHIKETPVEPTGARDVLPTLLEAAHDTIAVVGHQYTHKAVRDGFWDDRNAWEPGTLPAQDSSVYVPYGRSVVVRDRGAVCRSLLVFGEVKFAKWADTQLVVRHVYVMPEGYLEIGTASEPIPADRTAVLVFEDAPLETAGGAPFKRRLYTRGYDRSNPATHHLRWNPRTGRVGV